MITSTAPADRRLPPITLTHTLYDRLGGMAAACEQRQPEVAAYLERELDRAVVVDDDRLPATVVTIGSLVGFEEQETGARHTVTLCWPAEEDAAAHRVSVMTPVGVALIGLKQGQSIAWRNRAGAWRTLRILSVTPPSSTGAAAGT
ncbi:nucleoside diphosphate kinase regulator [Novispirillum sp. DQ9]|uniref:nucleoside diphosphate kinase regulator n=1 Tax=Novispirillum sp. DQ9 TaxID=3398612 RepID=UPI003C7B7CFC